MHVNFGVKRENIMIRSSGSTPPPRPSTSETPARSAETAPEQNLSDRQASTQPNFSGGAQSTPSRPNLSFLDSNPPSGPSFMDSPTRSGAPGYLSLSPTPPLSDRIDSLMNPQQNSGATSPKLNLYHGTSYEGANNILEKGFSTQEKDLNHGYTATLSPGARGKYGQEASANHFFTTDKNTAYEIADGIAGPGQSGSVLKVQLSKSEMEGLGIEDDPNMLVFPGVLNLRTPNDISTDKVRVASPSEPSSSINPW